MPHPYKKNQIPQARLLNLFGFIYAGKLTIFFNHVLSINLPPRAHKAAKGRAFIAPQDAPCPSLSRVRGFMTVLYTEYGTLAGRASVRPVFSSLKGT